MSPLEAMRQRVRHSGELRGNTRTQGISPPARR
jgi:hypothetical protein